MKSLKINLILVAIAASAVYFVSCSKKAMEKSPIPTSTNEDALYTASKNSSSDSELFEGVLMFKNRAAFEEALISIEQNKPIVLPKDFVSMADIFGEVLKAEDAFFEEYAKTHVPDTTLKSVVDVHSDVYWKNKDIIIYTKIGVDNTIMEMDIFSSSIAKLVNRDGLVIVNDTIYAYTKDAVYFCDKLNKGAINGASSIPHNNNYSVYYRVGKTAQENTACNYCYTADYRYASVIFNKYIVYPPSRSRTQNLVEYYLNQVHSPGNNNCITESKMSIRYRHLKLNFFTGSYSTNAVFGYVFGQFTGPRSPSLYYQSNGYSNMQWANGDMTIDHCYDFTTGNSNCFIANGGAYGMYTPDDSYAYPSQVTW